MVYRASSKDIVGATYGKLKGLCGKLKGLASLVRTKMAASGNTVESKREIDTLRAE